MTKLNKDDVEVRTVAKLGRGVFAATRIATGAVISVNATWPLEPTDLARLELTSIAGHWFDNPEKPGHALLALGIISLVNHSSSPNARIEWEKEDIGWIGKLQATATIAPGDQIFIDYGLSEEELPFLNDKGFSSTMDRAP